MMGTHCLQRLDDRCTGLYCPWLTGFVSMWPQSVGAGPSSVFFRGLDDAHVGCSGCVIEVPVYSILG